MATKMQLLASVLLLVLSSSSCAKANVNSSGESRNSSSTIVIRRKIPSRAIVGGNRFSLMNSRFNRPPKKKNLDKEHLLEILGDFYDPLWMSIEEPPTLHKEGKGITYVVREDSWPYQELTKALRFLNLSSDLATLTDGGKVILDPNTLSVLEKWLLKKASCPVKYAWEDIGTLFWPRWIRRGECASVPGTCSWPPGMHCVETNRSNLHILRWQCRAPKGKGRRRQSKLLTKKDWARRPENDPLMLRCQWVRVPYPITSACHCTC